MDKTLELAARLRLVECKSYSQIGAAMGITKWQARDLVKEAEAYLDGYGEGFKAATALRSAEGAPSPYGPIKITSYGLFGATSTDHR